MLWRRASAGAHDPERGVHPKPGVRNERRLGSRGGRRKEVERRARTRRTDHPSVPAPHGRSHDPESPSLRSEGGRVLRNGWPGPTGTREPVATLRGWPGAPERVAEWSGIRTRRGRGNAVPTPEPAGRGRGDAVPSRGAGGFTPGDAVLTCGAGLLRGGDAVLTCGAGLLRGGDAVLTCGAGRSSEAGTPSSPVAPDSSEAGTPSSPVAPDDSEVGTPSSPVAPDDSQAGTPSPPLRTPSPPLGTPSSPLRTPSPPLRSPNQSPGRRPHTRGRRPHTRGRQVNTLKIPPISPSDRSCSALRPTKRKVSVHGLRRNRPTSDLVVPIVRWHGYWQPASRCTRTGCVRRDGDTLDKFRLTPTFIG